MKNPKFSIRPACPEDVGHFVRIEKAAYIPPLAESGETFLSKLSAFPMGCKMAEIEGEPVGYLLSHPWSFNEPPPLECLPFQLPDNPDSYFIHSLTLSKAAHGKGIGTALAEVALQLGSEAGFCRFGLISVQDSQAFWERFGFREWNNPPARVVQKLQSYGPNARYMVKTVD